MFWAEFLLPCVITGSLQPFALSCSDVQVSMFGCDVQTRCPDTPVCYAQFRYFNCKLQMLNCDVWMCSFHVTSSALRVVPGPTADHQAHLVHHLSECVSRCIIGLNERSTCLDTRNSIGLHYPFALLFVEDHLIHWLLKRPSLREGLKENSKVRLVRLYRLLGCVCVIKFWR